MNHPALITPAAILLAAIHLASCSTDNVEHRQDRRTNHTHERQDRREIRQDARQERTDAWYDRAMH